MNTVVDSNRTKILDCSLLHLVYVHAFVICQVLLVWTCPPTVKYGLKAVPHDIDKWAHQVSPIMHKDQRKTLQKWQNYWSVGTLPKAAKCQTQTRHTTERYQNEVPLNGGKQANQASSQCYENRMKPLYVNMRKRLKCRNTAQDDKKFQTHKTHSNSVPE